MESGDDRGNGFLDQVLGLAELYVQGQHYDVAFTQDLGFRMYEFEFMFGSTLDMTILYCNTHKAGINSDPEPHCKPWPVS